MSQTAGSSSRERLWANLALLLVAAIWGSAFVAQRLGLEKMGPFAFNAVRFAVGALVLLPIHWARSRASKAKGESQKPLSLRSSELRGGLLLGLLLFAGASFQQIGLIYTTAGKAGFITGLYIVIVPLLLALVWRERVEWSSWLGAGLALVGLFLLSQQELGGLGDHKGSPLLGLGFQLAPGDGWVLIGALMWALHVIAIGRIAPGRNPLRLAMIQYTVCFLLSMPIALVLEPGTWAGIFLAAPALLYTGLLSTGLGYTGQVIAQRHTTPTHAAIILSLESVFAALAGWLFLEEVLSMQQLIGCGLMLAGMLLAQVRVGRKT